MSDAAEGPGADGRPAPVVRLDGVGLAYGKTLALDGVTLDIPAGRMVGLIGPDGVGKSSLLSLIAGARAVQRGRVEVLGGDIANDRHRGAVCPRIAYMPQGLGRNLYPTLSVFENIDFFGRLFGHGRAERTRRIAELVGGTGLAPFVDRPAGKLSGGMKQKLGLCCALIHDPDLLVLDEPTTGVDPLSRRQFWELIERIRRSRPGMSVLVATAYMEEAARFDRLIAMDAGRVLALGSPAELLDRTRSQSLEATFIAMLPEEKRRAHRPVVIPPRPADGDEAPAIEARGLTMRFGDFVAVDNVSFRIGRGEIFGFLGSNGCGKTTTMKMLTGLLPPGAGEARLFGRTVDAGDLAVRRSVGYMSQSFSLYTELTVAQNLRLHARLFQVPEAGIGDRVAAMVDRFGLGEVRDALPDALPLGHRQRLSLAVAMIHRPAMLILDEPTSGVDPVARDEFWRMLAELSRRDRVTIFISTHFMNEAERCDRVALMHAGRVLVTDTPAGLVAANGGGTLEQAFIRHLEAAAGEPLPPPAVPPPAVPPPAVPPPAVPVSAPAREQAPAAARPAVRPVFDLRRVHSYMRREGLELRRDPLRLTLALLGSVILMCVMGYGINMDVEELTFAVLDRDQTSLSRDYALNLAGSRYFVERPPLTDYQALDRRMRDGEISVALEIPSGFARDIARGRPVGIGAWLDGAMPQRAETALGYVRGMHAHWLTAKAREAGRAAEAEPLADIVIRYRYNPDVRSIVAMVPAVIPLLLMMIPAMLAALSVVREKELGSIVNLYVTPTTRLEFLIGKQIPYILLSVISFLLLTVVAVTLFDVPLKGSALAFLAAATVYVSAATGFGLLVSTFMRSQIAAIFATTVLTMLPAVNFSGMIHPVASLEGVGRLIGEVFPTAYFLVVARGIFSKGLGFTDIQGPVAAMLVAVPVLTGLATALLRKQER